MKQISNKISQKILRIAQCSLCTETIYINAYSIQPWTYYQLIKICIKYSLSKLLTHLIIIYPSMNDIKQEQISCNLSAQRQFVIFDSDNLVDSAVMNSQNTNKSESKEQEGEEDNQENLIQIKQEKEGIDPKLIAKLDEELKNTHEQLFKMVNIKANKNSKNRIKSLESIERISEFSINSILKQGYMEKKTDALIFKWKRRYFTLTPEKLYFFEDDHKEKIIGCVNIKIVPLEVKEEGQEIILDFNGECQNIHLKCYNKDDHQQWKQWIEQVSSFQAGEKKMFLKTINKPFYSQSNTITERQFLSEAQTGDVLLFYTRHMGASIQRALTNSDFDHVAMVVRFRSYQLMVFESNQATGVSLFQWNQYVRHFNLYDKITYRRLVSPRKTQLQHDLLKFVKITLGRKYQLNISKLFTFQSDFNWQMVNEDESRGYFCSELIAKAYKSIGLLDKKKSSCRYWPVDFSEKGEMKLSKGAYLGPEQQIVLMKHVKKII